MESWLNCCIDLLDSINISSSKHTYNIIVNKILVISHILYLAVLIFQVDPTYRSLLEDTSVDYIQKFRELASQMNSDQ